jgi:hypothetical protein
MCKTFVDDDLNFTRWRDTHPGGFIVNHERQPSARYLKLHRATCSTLQGEPARGEKWTKAYAKTCSDELAALQQWAVTVGGELDRCRLCAP